MISALDGHSSEGLSTTVLPAAMQGAILAQIWLSGQFHGVIAATTPIGSCTKRAFAPGTGASHSKPSSASSVPTI